MKIALISLLISFVLTPWQLIQKASDYSDTSSPTVKIVGENSDGKPVVMNYSLAEDTLKFIEDGKETVYKKGEIPLFYRFFFAPETNAKRVDFIVKTFKNAGYQLEEKSMSRSDDKKQDLYVLGKDEKVVFFSAQNYQIYKVKFPDGEAVFTEYHKSVRPLSFPGKIEIKTIDGIKNYTFIRKELKTKSE